MTPPWSDGQSRGPGGGVLPETLSPRTLACPTLVGSSAEKMKSIRSSSVERLFSKSGAWQQVKPGSGRRRSVQTSV